MSATTCSRGDESVLCICAHCYAKFRATTDTDQGIGKQRSMRTLNLALRIADRAVRSDIELYATGVQNADGTPVYDVTRPDTGGDPAGAARYQAIVEDALNYIDLRGDAFPWRLHWHITESLVWFTDKEPTP